MSHSVTITRTTTTTSGTALFVNTGYFRSLPGLLKLAQLVFGIFMTAAYAASSYLLYQEHKASVSAVA